MIKYASLINSDIVINDDVVLSLKSSLFFSRVWKFAVCLQTRALLQSCEVFLGGFYKTLFEYINVYSLAWIATYFGQRKQDTSR